MESPVLDHDVRTITGESAALAAFRDGRVVQRCEPTVVREAPLRAASERVF